MKLRRWPRLGLLALAGLLAAAKPVATQVDQAAANRIRGHVQFLASDELEGRGTGSRGYNVAAAYVAAQFASLGLKPAGTNGGWYLQVPFRTATHARPPQIQIISNGRSRLAGPADIGLRPSLTQKQRAFEAGLVFVGHGIVEPKFGVDEYAGVDVRGKIAVVIRGSPRGLPADAAAHLEQVKDDIAFAKGAVGIAELTVPGGRGGGIGGASRTVTDWIDPAGAVGNSSSRFAALVLSADASRQLLKGEQRSLEQIAASRGQRMRAFALRSRLSVKAESKWEDFSSPQIVGMIPGSDPRLASEYVFLMGHLDHLGLKENPAPREDPIYNGALDNAAGIATMIEAARHFVDAGKKPRRSVLFMANTGEERGLLGASYYIAHPTVPVKQIVAAVDLDMPLLLYDFTDIVAFGADHSTVARTVAQAARGMGISVAADPMPEQTIFVRSDHYQFVRGGVPAILLFTGYANGGKAKWDDFFARVYHKPNDDMSQPINWNAGARYARLNYEISRILADADQRPLWYRGDYFGERFAPGQPRAAR
jgi:Zn-dependent M28 family amino/carboxypeptidase